VLVLVVVVVLDTEQESRTRTSTKEDRRESAHVRSVHSNRPSSLTRRPPKSYNLPSILVEDAAMKAVWRYVQFWSVIVFAAAMLCVVLTHLQQLMDKT
jgi:hypothetical protein